MGQMNLDTLDRKWEKTFNLVMKGYVHVLPNIAPSGLDQKEFAQARLAERNARSRDVMTRDRRTPMFLADVDYVVEPAKAPVTTRGRYAPQDYHAHDGDIESAYIEALGTRPGLRLVRGEGGIPSQGSQVRITIPGHFYEHHVGYIVSSRKGGREFLIEVVSKRPGKRNSGGLENRGKMWASRKDFVVVS